MSHNELHFLHNRRKIDKEEKVMCNLNDKENYVMHTRNSKQAQIMD